MSERFSRSCAHKKRYNSMRRAEEAAKSSKIVYGIELNAYFCEFCRKFHCGATHPWEGRTEREAQIEHSIP